MPAPKNIFTGNNDFTATAGELADAEAMRDTLAEEAAINPQYAALPRPKNVVEFTE